MTMEPKPYIEKEIKSWEQYKNFVDKLSNNWIFRGQSNSEWELKTSLERTRFFNKFDGVETSFLIDFQRAAKNFLGEKDIPNDVIEWLALMQHHGAPTRLIDFTKSPFTASYFAFEQVESNINNIAIWAIDTNLISKFVVRYLKPYYPKEFEKSHNLLSDETFEKLFFQNNFDCIMPIEPFKMNKRYYLQQSIFISPGNSINPFMEQMDFLSEANYKPMIKFIISSELQREVLTDLEKMNINRATLFPDLDGYARSLKTKYDLKNNFEDSIKMDKIETEFLKQENIITKNN
jgi:FRG domain